MTSKQRQRLETALKRLEKCGGDCRHCIRCHIYTGSTAGAIYMAVGCDMLPADMFNYIADSPRELHAAALDTVRFELS